MSKDKPKGYDTSRLTGAAFWEDIEKQKTCKHGGVTRSDVFCPHCNLIIGAAASAGNSVSDQLKQCYAKRFLDARGGKFR